jgi:hypothetical protein
VTIDADPSGGRAIFKKFPVKFPVLSQGIRDADPASADRRIAVSRPADRFWRNKATAARNPLRPGVHRVPENFGETKYPFLCRRDQCLAEGFFVAPISVIPGRREAANPESRKAWHGHLDSGFAGFARAPE